MVVSYKKRFFDLVVIVLASVAWVPVLALGAAAIALFEGRPVFYVSTRRVGDHTARIVKFRTMVPNAEAVFNRDVVPIAGSIRFLNTPRDSPLYTRVGRIIERFGLTEIPQVVHVLKGEMSLVGNRPLPDNVVSALKDAFPDVEQRFGTPAGMTGPVQLVGRSAMTDEERLAIEREYCDIARQAQSWRLDFAILCNTVLVVLGLRRPFEVEEVRTLMRRYRNGASVTESDASGDSPHPAPAAPGVTPDVECAGSATMSGGDDSVTPVRRERRIGVTACAIPDLLLIQPTVFRDNRGFFLESYNRREFAAATGIDIEFVQDNHSLSACGVLRGLHYQLQYPQAKLVRVIRGTVFDVAVDIRRSSPFFGKAVCVELSAEGGQVFWIPPGFAHGFLAVSDIAELTYKISEYRHADDEHCIAWDDPDIAIPWPLTEAPVLSAKDNAGVRLRDAATMP